MGKSKVSQPALAQARLLYADGVGLADVGQLSEARQTFEEALRLLDIDPTRRPRPRQVERDTLGARVLISLAFPVAYLGDVGEGLAVLDRADRLLAGVEDPGIQALAACNRGLMLVDAGRPEDGLVELDRATELAAYASIDQQLKIKMNRADAHRLLGHVREASRELTSVLQLAREHALPEFEFQATHNLGFVTYLAGDLPRALSLMPEVTDATTDYERGVVGSGRAEVLLAAGLIEEADAVLVEASAALRATDYGQLLGEAQLTRAEAALRREEYALADHLSDEAATQFGDSGNDRLRALAELVRLRARAKVGLAPQETYDRATVLARTLTGHGLTDDSRTALLLAAEASLDDGNLTDGIDVAVRRGEPVHLRLHVRLVRARKAFALGDVRRGRREVRRGMDELAEYQAKFGSFDLQTSSAAHGVDLAALAVTRAVAADRPAEVLDLLERVRAITGHVPEVRPPADPAVAALLTELRWVVSQLEDDETDADDLDGLRRRRQQLERRIRSSAWGEQGQEGRTGPPSLAELRERLGVATMVVVFWLDTGLHGIVVTADRCRMQPLGPVAEAERLAKRVNADLDALAFDHVPEPVRQAALGSLRTDLAALDGMLLAPLEVPDGPVVLLPPGRLAGLPWGALPTLSGRPLTVAPSAAAWVDASAGRSPAAGPVVGPVVVVAGPGLVRAETEAAAVAAAWPGCRRLVGPDATGAAVLAALDGAALVHLAAHGRHQPSSPLFSAIRLADGPVVAYDLDRVPRPPGQVVLSACDLGQATVRPGDEALGLTRALLHSGVSTVVAGVAKVSDRRAEELMVAYHQRLAAGAAPAYALADALGALDEPLPFVCFGAGW